MFLRAVASSSEICKARGQVRGQCQGTYPHFLAAAGERHEPLAAIILGGGDGDGFLVFEPCQKRGHAAGINAGLRADS